MTNLRNVIPGLVALALVAPAVGLAASASEQAEAAANSALEPRAEGEHHATPAPAPAATTTASAQPKDPAAAGKDGKKTSATLTAEELEEQGGFGIGVDLSHSLATSTFAAPDTNAFFGGSLGLSARYTFSVSGQKLSAAASWGVALEYTLPDNDTNGRRFSHSDLRLGLSAPRVLKIPVADIGITPSLGLVVPLTAESWSAGLITQLSAGLAFSRGWKYFDVGLSVSGARGFHTSAVNTGVGPAADNAANKDKYGFNTVICRTGETVCNMLGNNVAWSLGGAISATVKPMERLSFGINFGLRKSWAYELTSTYDEFTAEKLDTNGNRIAQVGMVDRDSMSGSLSASYSVSDHVGVTLALSNSGPVLWNDTHTVRFPFFQTRYSADGGTALSLAVSGSF